jgi:ATP-dependent Clp protease ATP-binding subunit ClpA
VASPSIARELQATFRASLAEAKRMRHEYLTLEHLLLAMLRDKRSTEVLKACGANLKRLEQKLTAFLMETVEQLPDGAEADPQQTIGVERVFQRAAIHALSAEQKTIDGGDVLVALFREEESYALFLLKEEGISRIDILNYVSHGITKDADADDEGGDAEQPVGDELDGEGPQRGPLKAYTTLLNEEAKAGRIDPQAISEAAISDRLDTAAIPDPDLLIRTSGEQRLSNYLLWQCAYTELVFVDEHWPDFTAETLNKALSEYMGRDRRFGRLRAQTA